MKPVVLASILLILFPGASRAATTEETCLLDALKTATDDTTVAQLRTHCKIVSQPIGTAIATENKADAAEQKNEPVISNRLQRERYVDRNPFGLTAHRRNYFLPITYSQHPNAEPYAGEPNPNDYSLDNAEVKFQLSVKLPLIEEILTKDDSVYFGFTMQSFWQLYNDEISAPFRETNYEPEIYYQFVNDWEFAGWTNRLTRFGFVHQSNGRAQPYSRSWNRIFAQFLLENDNWALSFKPWYRLPEDKKDDPSEADGDDNPDIDDYMGYFELTAGTKYDDQEFSVMLRNNLRSDNKGAVQLDWTFPLYGRLRGYAQYYNGYGESLLDYNASIERVGIGFLLTDSL